jgi:hypothetical protein
MKHEKKLTRQHYVCVMLKAAEEANELAAELLKAVNKSITPDAIDKIAGEIGDIKKQLKLLSVLLDDFRSRKCIMEDFKNTKE